MPLSQKLIRFAGLVVVAAALAVLAACSHGVRPVSEGGSVSGNYGLVIDAYKGGQFLIDGAVLAGPDLDGHLAYLKSTGALPKSVLLEDGADSNVRSAQLTEFAQLATKYGFSGFVLHKGKLRPLQAADGDG